MAKLLNELLVSDNFHLINSVRIQFTTEKKKSNIIHTVNKPRDTNPTHKYQHMLLSYFHFVQIWIPVAK